MTLLFWEKLYANGLRSDSRIERTQYATSDGYTLQVASVLRGLKMWVDPMLVRSMCALVGRHSQQAGTHHCQEAWRKRFSFYPWEAH